MRFLVVDEQNDKLVGILGLGSPIFSLRVRDEWIGWDVEDRRKRLIHVMDAFVLGAVPPYSQLLCGKLVGSLAASAELSDAFRRKYHGRVGAIRGKRASAELALVTTSSALGRSSTYNRLSLPGLLSFERLGWTSGWGHFQIPDAVFEDMRRLLALSHHKYASGNRYGDGPNWRMRVVRVALEEIGFDASVLRHGIKREVFGLPIASNWREFLTGSARQPILRCPSTRTIADACLDRWILPRSVRDPSYLRCTRSDIRRAMLRHQDLA